MSEKVRGVLLNKAQLAAHYACTVKTIISKLGMDCRSISAANPAMLKGIYSIALPSRIGVKTEPPPTR